MSWIIIISLIIIGLIFLVLEILVIPGVIVGIIGAVMVIMGVFFSYNNGSTAGNITLAGTVLLSIFTLVFIFRSKTWDRLTLKNENKSRVNEIDENVLDDWGGETQFKFNGDIVACQPVTNSLVIFKSNIFHRGMAPSRFSPDMRVTIAWKFMRE